MVHPFKIDRVLFATDLSPTCESALRCAASLANRFNAELYLLHVVSAPNGPGPASDASEQQAATAMRQLRQELLATHDKYTTTAVLCGEPAARILQKAADIRADLIVMGASSHCPQPGSLTDAVIRGATCLVMTVPHAHPEQVELRP